MFRARKKTILFSGSIALCHGNPFLSYHFLYYSHVDCFYPSYFLCLLKNAIKGPAKQEVDQFAL